MTITTDDLLKLLPGSKAVVSDCKAAEHGDSRGCLCKLKGQIVTIGTRFATPFVGSPTWWITPDRTARLSELTLVCEES